jgi:hypothetical protein
LAPLVRKKSIARDIRRLMQIEDIPHDSDA